MEPTPRYLAVIVFVVDAAAVVRVDAVEAAAGDGGLLLDNATPPVPPPIGNVVVGEFGGRLCPEFVDDAMLIS